MLVLLLLFMTKHDLSFYRPLEPYIKALKYVFCCGFLTASANKGKGVGVAVKAKGRFRIENQGNMNLHPNSRQRGSDYVDDEAEDEDESYDEDGEQDYNSDDDYDDYGYEQRRRFGSSGSSSTSAPDNRGGGVLKRMRARDKGAAADHGQHRGGKRGIQRILSNDNLGVNMEWRESRGRSGNSSGEYDDDYSSRGDYSSSGYDEGSPFVRGGKRGSRSGGGKNKWR